ncbi:MAG: hypothetical protein COT91_03485 [Candidatus Doudnabacteria bacterium CG10_big_fil_rev_8_21_14_0_10_41_10]|uniref:ABC transporter domain-containing protein n=1 Tax=Candidatus Doudnabacteria bacterium CG10_big_fil_rev_8_21_14_0_10_41_10 TaxID=1974551 RepID=A0A2H0VD53_9BACT|nr:MAG: hypothetical protein COT91_03485 [Candidatus Doudnabacteria bacterium CG10_big_fil_rev_8_21_14_0_10_41_10]
MVKYNKLVRDKIPEILDQKNILYEKRFANDSEYKEELIKKLLEEVTEFAETPTEEELADVIEVIESFKKLSEYKSVEKVRLNKKEIGYLAGSVRAYDNWTGQQHINFALSLNGKKNIASNLATRLQFNPKVKTKNLSSGNRQKLGVILAFMFEPKVAILDEPTNALDPLMQNIIYDIIREQTYKGATVFMSSHNLAEVERVCSRVGIIRQGKMVAVESMESLKEKQMHRVKVVFAGKYDKGEFLTLGGSEVVMASPEELILNVRGEIASILRVLSAHRMKNLEIGRASLEDIFMEYYER